MGRYLVTCCLAVLLILVQFDLSLSGRSSSSSSRSSSSSSSSSSSKGRKPGRPAQTPSHNKPRPPQTQPKPPQTWPKPPQTQPRPPQTWPKPPQTQPRPPQTQPKPPPSWPKPSLTQPKPVETQPKPAQIPHKHDDPIKPAQNPGLSQHNPPSNPERPPPYNPSYPQNPGQPQNPAYPPHNPSYPQNPGQPQNPAYPPHNPNYPQNPGQPQNPAYPPHNPSYPQNPGQPQNPAYPPHNPNYPQNPGQPQNPAYPPHNPSYPQNPGQPQNPAYPPHNPSYPQNPAYPPHNPNYPQNPGQPQNPAYPPQNPAYPPHNPNYPQNPGQPQNPAYPPHNPSYPQNPAYPPQNPGQPQNPAYPPHNPNYPRNPGYPQNPGHSPQNPGYPQHPGYPQNPGYGGGGSSWDHYDSKPWKPKPPKLKMKHMAGSAIAGAAVGALGGYALGSALSNMRFRFNNHDEERWWYENRNRYSDRVYYPKYDQPISRDVFVRDCVNITVKEYIEPTGNQTEDEMETRVVTRVVHEMCIEQYRLQSSDAEGGNSRRPESKPEGPPTPTELETKPLPGAPVSGTAASETASGYLLSDMHFHFNSSKEDQWWQENRHRYLDHVYYPNYSQPVSGDIFVSDCWNASLREYIRPSGNQTADEMEFRVLTQVAHEMCAEQYRRYTNPAGRDGSDHDGSKPEKHNPPQRKMKQVAEEAVASSEFAVLGSSPFESSVPNVHFHFDYPDEEQWWYKTHNYSSYPVFYYGHSQSAFKDDFTRCLNETFKRYMRPSGNQAADELATRAVTKAVHTICTEHYNLMSGVAVLLASPSMQLSILMLVSCFLIQ